MMRTTLFLLPLLVAASNTPLAGQIAEGPVELVAQGPPCGDLPLDSRRQPVVAASGAGTFFIAWEAIQDNDCKVFGRIFASDGTPRGDAFPFGAPPAGSSQRNPELSATPEGDFLAVWEDHAPNDEDTRLLFCRFSATGTCDAPLFFGIEPGTTPRNPAIATGGGNTVVVWELRKPGPASILALGLRRSVGAKLESDFPTEGIHINPAVAVAQDGSFVVVWEDETNHALGDADIWMRAFDVLGTPVGGPRRLNLFMPGLQRNPAIAALSRGDFVAVWDSAPVDDDLVPTDSGIFSRQIASGGVPIGPELQVNSFVEGFQTEPVVGVDTAGGFVVAWNDDSALLMPASEVPRNRVSGQWLSSDAWAIDGQVRLDDEGDAPALFAPIHRPAIAALPDHRFVVVWSAYSDEVQTLEIRYRLFGPSDLYRECVAAGSTLCPEQARIRSKPARRFSPPAPERP